MDRFGVAGTADPQANGVHDGVQTITLSQVPHPSAVPRTLARPYSVAPSNVLGKQGAHPVLWCLS